MARFAFLIALALLITTGATAFAQEEKEEKAPGGLSPDEVAKRVQGFYRETKDFNAAFEQTYHDVAADSKKVSVGHVYFKKPGKMRWDYKKASNPKKMDKLYVSDGKSFWVYEYEFKQVFKQCLKSSQLPTAISFLMGQGDLLSQFDVTFAKGSSAKKPKLKLTPKEPTSKYKHLVFEVDPETFQVEQTTLYDPYGNKNVVEFKNAKVNQNLPDSGFAFKPPKNARVLNPQKKCP